MPDDRLGEVLPYPGEEYVRAALTTGDLPANVEVGDEGERSRPAEDVVLLAVDRRDRRASGRRDRRAPGRREPQGAVTGTFADRMRAECRAYPDP